MFLFPAFFMVLEFETSPSTQGPISGVIVLTVILLAIGIGCEASAYFGRHKYELYEDLMVIHRGFSYTKEISYSDISGLEPIYPRRAYGRYAKAIIGMKFKINSEDDQKKFYIENMKNKETSVMLYNWLLEKVASNQMI